MRNEDITGLDSFDSLEVLEANINQIEGISGALECSKKLDERLLKSCLVTLSALANESAKLVEHLRHLPS